MKKQLKRTSLYASGSSAAKMLEARFYNQDCIVYDLEDSVSQGEKDAARFLVYQTVRYHKPDNQYVLIRVNGLYSAYIEEDLQAAVRARPDAIRLPKVEHPEEVQRIDQKISEIEKAAGIPVGTTELWCNIESVLGAVNAQSISTASPRVVALALGAEDYTASMGALRTKAGPEIFYARMQVLQACRLAGISAQDAVFSDFRDTEGLKEDLKTTRTLGFDGKTVIHPSQIDLVNAAFTPSQKEIRYAERVLAALRDGEKQSTGVVSLDGSMIDKPMEIRAKTILAQAEAAGMWKGED